MALEIEHKFLVNSTAYRSLAKPVLYRQGYLAVLPDKIVRVRTVGETGFITVKFRVSQLTRKEFEYEIPVSDTMEMLDGMCIGPIVEKYRYTIDYKNFIWEVDEFLGDNTGLIVAEIEVDTEGQQFEKPDWVGEEVTHNPRYLNSNLSKHPFNTWNK
ncbi:MAG: CYTH domain-containing protein [Lentimicrobium sp.]|nr:CYTH domain-containing protein [Lentimicrobium sp.]